MDQNFLIAIVAFLGTILGAVVGGIIPHHLQEKSNFKLYRRQKLEELYVDISHWMNTSFWTCIINFYLVFDKTVDWNQYLDKIINLEDDKGFDFFKSEITINFYFKNLLPNFNNLVKALRDINRFINNEIKSCYLAGKDIIIYKSSYDNKVKNIVGLMDKLKSSIQEMTIKL
jgi:hypothetical protein